MPKPSPPIARIVAAESLGGERVVDRKGNAVGAIEDLVIDVPGGKIAFAVMSLGENASASRLTVRWGSLSRDEARSCFVLDEDP